MYLRVGRSESAMVASVLPTITEIGGKRASISSLFSAATMRHAHIFLQVRLITNNFYSSKSNTKEHLNFYQSIKKIRIF